MSETSEYLSISWSGEYNTLDGRKVAFDLCVSCVKRVVLKEG